MTPTVSRIADLYEAVLGFAPTPEQIAGWGRHTEERQKFILGMWEEVAKEEGIELPEQ